jgi:hypothetical protein
MFSFFSLASFFVDEYYRIPNILHVTVGFLTNYALQYIESHNFTANRDYPFISQFQSYN